MKKDIEKYLEDLVKELESMPGDDDGHINLLRDLLSLLKEAADFEFHDFKNNKYAMPKVMLRSKLIELAKNVEEGRYDN